MVYGVPWVIEQNLKFRFHVMSDFYVGFNEELHNFEHESIVFNRAINWGRHKQ